MMANDKIIALTATSERPATTSSGYAMLIVLLLAILADVYGVQGLANDQNVAVHLTIVALATLVFILIMPGFFMLQPNQAAAITLFGEYRGSDRATGLRWTWPWLAKKKLSVRANNFISDKIKGNDLRGNPDRNGSADRLACGRHGAGAVRRRRLSLVRQRPGR